MQALAVRLEFNLFAIGWGHGEILSNISASSRPADRQYLIELYWFRFRTYAPAPDYGDNLEGVMYSGRGLQIYCTEEKTNETTRCDLRLEGAIRSSLRYVLWLSFLELGIFFQP